MADNPPKVLRDLLDAGDIVMLTTMVDATLSSRPMTVAGVGDDHIELLISSAADWVPPVASGAAVVHVSLCDVRSNDYAALDGSATLSRDRADIDRLWSPAAEAFFDGKGDPDIAVLRYEVSGGEYWDAPSGRIGALVAMVRAAVGGADVGEHGSIATT